LSSGCTTTPDIHRGKTFRPPLAHFIFISFCIAASPVLVSLFLKHFDLGYTIAVSTYKVPHDDMTVIDSLEPVQTTH
jgi:hypothetical protein